MPSTGFEPAIPVMRAAVDSLTASGFGDLFTLACSCLSLRIVLRHLRKSVYWQKIVCAVIRVIVELSLALFLT